MGYSWVYLGDAELPVATQEAWLDHIANPDVELAALDPVVRARFRLDGAGNVAVLDLLRELSGEVAIIELEGAVRLRVLADKSGDAWLTWRGALAAAFAALGKLGGRGRLDVVGFEDGPDEGFRLDVDGAADLALLDAAEVANVRARRAYRELVAYADKVYAREKSEERDAPPPPPPPGSYLDHAMRTIAQRVFFDPRDGLKRVERRILWALHPDGARQGLSAEAIAERVRARHPDQKVLDAQILSACARRRTATLSLVDERDGRYLLSPLAAEALAEVATDDPAAFTDAAGADARVLPLPVPWLLVAGGQAIGVGLRCDIAPVPPATLLRALLDRMAHPPREPAEPVLAEGATVLVAEAPVVLGLSALLDAFLAHRRTTLSQRGLTDVDARITADLRRWLGEASPPP